MQVGEKWPKQAVHQAMPAAANGSAAPILRACCALLQILGAQRLSRGWRGAEHTERA